MGFTAKDVQELRQRTGAGMMDCKRALEETEGAIDKAVDLLRMKGVAKAEKRAGRAAKEGQIVSAFSGDGTIGALVEVNCETDFVGRNEQFLELARSIAAHVLANSTLDGIVPDSGAAALLDEKWRGGGAGGTVADVIKEASARTGENIVVRRYARFATAGVLGSYVHHNGKVAGMAELVGAKNEDVQSVAKSVAEHVVAGVPTVALGVSKDDISAETVERERRIFEEQARSSGKPENIVQKMIEGRIDKFFKEVALLEQKWIRDDTKTIRDLINEASKRAGAPVQLKRFVRFQMGE